MQRITSAQNERIKQVRRLSTSAKARREQWQTLIEGIHVSEAYLAAGHQPECCLVSETALDNGEIARLLSRIPANLQVVVPDSLFSSFSTVEHGVGIVLVVVPPPAASVTPELNDDALLLDGVQDPGNMGTMLRTAVAAGIKQVYVSEGSTSAWSPKALRAGMGAHFALDIYEKSNLLKLIKTATIPVNTTSLTATQTLYDVDLVGPTAWVFGAEGQGVSSEVLEITQSKAVIIPQVTEVESLNVAAAAAICLFEQRRQRLAMVSGSV